MELVRDLTHVTASFFTVGGVLVPRYLTQTLRVTFQPKNLKLLAIDQAHVRRISTLISTAFLSYLN